MDTNVTQAKPTLSERAAEEIRAWMGRRRITGAGMARKLGVSPAWVSYRLTGTQPIDLNDLERIARVLEVEVTDLLPRGGEGRLITTGGSGAGMGQITNARSAHVVERSRLTGHPKRTHASESTRRPARIHAAPTR